MKKSIALFFLIVFSISLPGLSVELHFCKGKITDVAVFGHAACQCEKPQEHAMIHNDHKISCEKQCHSKVQETSEKKTELYQKKCCKTEKLTLTSSKLKAHSTLKTAPVVMVIAAILNPYAVSDLLTTSQQVFVAYIPPLLEHDLTVLHRVFII